MCLSFCFLLIRWKQGSVWPVSPCRKTTQTIQRGSWEGHDLASFLLSLSSCRVLWRHHPKLLGPGALIFVAKQLWPKLVLTGSSSSEASIKATLFQDQQTTLTRRWAQRLQHRIFHTSQSDCSGKKFITNHVQSSKVLQSFNYSNYSSLIVQRKQ